MPTFQTKVVLVLRIIHSSSVSVVKPCASAVVKGKRRSGHESVLKFGFIDVWMPEGWKPNCTSVKHQSTATTGLSDESG